ncbi:hypothetical protein HIM_01717 [Hirsutella minnesotensis 3608]|nr:hypothetical protein HIM_01717 [Hirsutella minnesotensis 3608]
MSIPPQLIRVKRKRVEEAPVTFLQFDEGQKRHRSGSNWAYQRRNPVASSARNAVNRNDKPVIHSSRPEDTPTRKSLEAVPPRRDTVTACLAPSTSQDVEPRRFHISRSAISAAINDTSRSQISRQKNTAPAIFVERSRKRKAPSHRQEIPASEAIADSLDESQGQVLAAAGEERQLKRPGVAKRARDSRIDGPAHAPLPPSLMYRHTEDMDKITADMNQWVLNEIGANLHSMQQEKKQQAKSLRFKPKAPAQRYPERHPDSAPVSESRDVIMSDLSDDDDADDDDDWIIEEYVRIPAHSVAVDVAPSDIGVLVLSDDEESMLFFGSMHDEDDDFDEDEDDENAENYYTADYPEDEVASDDEYGRHAYGYRNGVASDDEEFDKAHHSNDEEDDHPLRGCDDDDEDMRLARIRAYMKRNSAFP